MTKLGLCRKAEAYQDVVGPCLKLTTPQSAKYHVVVAIVIQDCGVNAVSAGNRVGFGLEFSVGLVRFGHSDAEDIVLVLGWEKQVVVAVLLGRIRSPELLRRPWNVHKVQKLIFFVS